jgi:hypothetical protein
MSDVIDKNRVIELLQQAVLVKGDDYVDPRSSNEEEGCLYFEKSGAPSCIVGHVLYDLGIRKLYNNGEVSDIIDIDDSDNYFIGNHEFTPEAIDALSVAQMTQDHGYSWGKAVAEAKSV